MRRRKFLVITAVVVIIAIPLGVYAPQLSPSSPKKPSQAERLADLLDRSIALADALQDERDITAGPLTKGQKDDDFVSSTREDTDKARRAFLDSIDLPEEQDLVGFHASITAVIHRLNDLNRIRQSAYTTPDYVSQTANSYNELIEALLGFSQEMAQATSNTDMIRSARALHAFSSAKEDYSMQRAILSAALANPKGPELTDIDRYVARTTFQSEKSNLQQFRDIYGEKRADALTKVIDGDVVEIQLADRFREQALNSEKGIEVGDQSYLDWIDRATVKLNAMDTIQEVLLKDLHRQTPKD